MSDKKHVDIRKVLKTRTPRLYAYLPNFFINYLIRKLHEEDINYGINNYNHLFEHDFNKAGLDYVGAKVKWTGEEHIPRTGKVIIAANHPLGGLDGMSLIHAVSTVRTDTVFFVNDFLKSLNNYGDLFVGVNKIGSTANSALKVVVDEYSTEKAILVFPAGLVSRMQKGKVKDLEWKKSFVSKAVQYGSPIIPTFIHGQNSKFFYNFALWRKRLGIKANIEMFFLPDEMFSATNKDIHIQFGPPIPATVFDNSRSHREWAQIVKEYIYWPGFLKGETFTEFLKHYKPAVKH
jgi:1-acyl-sn-glycerol-3-phosphate acyltransferase